MCGAKDTISAALWCNKDSGTSEGLMKKVVLAGIAGFISAWGSAFAADMPVKAPVMPPPPVISWTGAYIGINGGWAAADATYSFTSVGFFNTLVGQGYTFNPRGGMIGGQVGYLMQNNWFVYGFEFAGDWTDLSQTVTGPVPAFPFDTYHTKITDMETLTARLGITPGAGFWLIYAKLGAASVNRQFSVLSGTPVAGEFASGTDRLGGLTAGGGIEFLFADHFVFGVEYMYANFGDTIHQLATCSVVATCGGSGVQNISLSASSNSNNLVIQTLLGRLSYKF
jgi:outer membrane immunogenic protein